MPVIIKKAKKPKTYAPIALNIDKGKLSAMVQEQADLQKKFFAAVSGKDMTDPTQAVKVFFKLFGPKE